MHKYEKIGVEIVKKLESSSYQVHCIGINNNLLAAYMDAKTIQFSCNVGGHYKPTKAAATEILLELKANFDLLYEHSPTFREYVGDRSFLALIEVFSGHMDFRVASLKDGQYDFYVTLD